MRIVPFQAASLRSQPSIATQALRKALTVFVLDSFTVAHFGRWFDSGQHSFDWDRAKVGRFLDWLADNASDLPANSSWPELATQFDWVDSRRNNTL